MEHKSFHIHFSSPEMGHYSVRVQSPAGATSQPCDLSEESIERWLAAAAIRIPEDREVWRSDQAMTFDQALEAIRGDIENLGDILSKQGEALHRAVFSQNVASLFHESLAKARAEEQPLAIVFHFQLEDPIQARLATLPWEQLYDPKKHRHLAQSIETPIVRFLESSDKDRASRLPKILRILAVTSAPSDLPPLDLSSAAELVGNWPQANIVVEHLANPDKATLRRTLRRKTFHVLHFDGHGRSDPGTGVGSIALVGPKGAQEWLKGVELGDFLSNHPQLRLVVLNSCSTGADPGKRAFTGFASALVRAGVAAVIAMRRPIKDHHAIAFARTLYEDLTRGHPLRSALSSARQELAAFGSDDWATPSLFVNTDEVFEIPVDIKPTLTRIFSWLGVITSNIAVNSWSGNRGGPQIPGFSFGNVTDESIPVLGILIVGPLLLLLQSVILRFQAQAPDRGLFFRLPIAFGLPVQNNRTVAEIYQALMLFVLVFIPLASQFHYLQRIHDGASWRLQAPHEIVTRGWGHLQHFELPGFLYGYDEFRFGPRKENWERNFICREGEVCEVSFFPFWQPWIYLWLTLLNTALFILICVGIWDPDPARWRARFWRKRFVLSALGIAAVIMLLAALSG